MDGIEFSVKGKPPIDFFTPEIKKRLAMEYMSASHENSQVKFLRLLIYLIKNGYIKNIVINVEILD